MPCYAPITAYRSKEVSPSGKRGMVFSPTAAHSGVRYKLPCGQCVGCRLEKSRQWAMRCIHEKQMHRDSCFVTLTYDDKNLPPDGTLVKRDLQLFMKRLRKRYGRSIIRFYACGEYGDRSGRPHYHILLFGIEFPDKRYVRRSNADEHLCYTSKICADLWGKGTCLIGDVTFDSAAYVARYVMKKVTGPLAENYYTWADSDGVIHSVLPEFTQMSRRPGIGSSWFAKYGSHAYMHDSVIMNGKEVRPPRFYDLRYDIVDTGHLDTLKKLRRHKALAHRADQTTDRRRVSEAVASARLTLNRRKI